MARLFRFHFETNCDCEVVSRMTHVINPEILSRLLSCLHGQTAANASTRTSCFPCFRCGLFMYVSCASVNRTWEVLPTTLTRPQQAGAASVPCEIGPSFLWGINADTKKRRFLLCTSSPSHAVGVSPAHRTVGHAVLDQLLLDGDYFE